MRKVSKDPKRFRSESFINFPSDLYSYISESLLKVHRTARLTNHSLIPCSPQGKRLLQASFGGRICSSKEARWDLGLPSFFSLSVYKIWNLECMLQLLQAKWYLSDGIYISRSTWFILTEKGRARPYQQLYCCWCLEIVAFSWEAVISSGWRTGGHLFT